MRSSVPSSAQQFIIIFCQINVGYMGLNPAVRSCPALCLPCRSLAKITSCNILCEIGVRILWEKFSYRFGQKIYHHQSGGPIGARITMACSRLLMQQWGESYTNITLDLGLTTSPGGSSSSSWGTWSSSGRSGRIRTRQRTSVIWRGWEMYAER